jgi:putative glutamine amidotransferase
VIGVSANYLHADKDRPLYRGKTLQYSEERLMLAVADAGALPFVIPDLRDPKRMRELVATLDGIVLSGGADVDPASYNEPGIDERWPGDTVRDAFEIGLVAIARERHLPVLGVCRGAQVLNVAFGGSLWQDIPTQLPNADVHRDWHRYDQTGHAIELKPGSWIASVYGGRSEIVVNSVHHQALKRIGEPLRVTAAAADGIVEAVEHIDHEAGAWFVGIQWHPEWIEAERVAADPDANGWTDGGPIFRRFAELCERR